MLKLILAVISYVILFRAYAARDLLLFCYWALVCVYWIFNFVRG